MRDREFEVLLGDGGVKVQQNEATRVALASSTPSFFALYIFDATMSQRKIVADSAELSVDHQPDQRQKRLVCGTVPDKQSRQLGLGARVIFWGKTKYRFGPRQVKGVRKTTSEVFPTTFLRRPTFWSTNFKKLLMYRAPGGPQQPYKPL